VSSLLAPSGASGHLFTAREMSPPSLSRRSHRGVRHLSPQARRALASIRGSR
jgi:hypothetical protein